MALGAVRALVMRLEHVPEAECDGITDRQLLPSNAAAPHQDTLPGRGDLLSDHLQYPHSAFLTAGHVLVDLRYNSGFGGTHAVLIQLVVGGVFDGKHMVLSAQPRWDDIQRQQYICRVTVRVTCLDGTAGLGSTNPLPPLAPAFLSQTDRMAANRCFAAATGSQVGRRKRSDGQQSGGSQPLQ